MSGAERARGAEGWEVVVADRAEKRAGDLERRVRKLRRLASELRGPEQD